MSKLHDMRLDYTLPPLIKADMPESPFELFNHWFTFAVEHPVPEANAVVLSTVNQHGQPSGRVVLLKEFDENGFVFFTNYDSRKGHELADNPFASLTFWWQPLHQQIRIEGHVERAATSVSDNYFNNRDKQANISACASPQSCVIDNRQQLEQRVVDLTEQYANQDNLPRPANWGGYRITPMRFEFWQGGKNRLHDRIQYAQRDSAWVIERLAP